MLSSPRSPDSTMRIFSSAVNCRRVTRRISFTTCSAGFLTGPDFCPIFAPSMATMGQKSSLLQLSQSVSWALMPDSPATTSEFSSIRTEPLEQQQRSAQMLTQRAREQASQAGDYVARNVARYPVEALLVAGLIGYGIAFLIHRGHYSEPREQTSAPEGHSGDVLRPLK